MNSSQQQVIAWRFAGNTICSTQISISKPKIVTFFAREFPIPDLSPEPASRFVTKCAFALTQVSIFRWGLLYGRRFSGLQSESAQKKTRQTLRRWIDPFSKTESAKSPNEEEITFKIRVHRSAHPHRTDFMFNGSGAGRVCAYPAL